MKYYKVNKEGANKYISNSKKRKAYPIYLIENELFTQKEKDYYTIPDKFLKEKEISKNKVFWNFGARFEIVN